MDGYAPEYVTPNLPLLVVSGLGTPPSTDAGHWEFGTDTTKIASEAPLVQSEDAEVLLRHIREGDGGELAWNGREYAGQNKFKVKVIGRVGLQTPFFPPPFVNR